MQCVRFVKFPKTRTTSALTFENLTKTHTAIPQTARIYTCLSSKILSHMAQAKYQIFKPLKRFENYVFIQKT